MVRRSDSRNRHFAAVSCLVLVPWGLAAAALAGEPKPPAVTDAVPGLKRTFLQKTDVPGTSYEATVLRLELAPNFEIGRHTHPGPEISYLLEGDVTYMVDGQPPVQVSSGGSISFPMGSIHAAKVGPKGAVMVNTYVLEKGQPLLTKLPPQP